MTQEDVLNQILLIKNIQNERIEKHFSWVRNILTLAVGLFGILIAFKTEQNQPFIKNIFFVSSITSIGIGILFSLIHLYAEVNVLDRLKKFEIQNTLNLIDGMSSTISKFEQIKPKWIYKFAGKMNILFFVIGLFCLIGYASYDLICQMN